jgi:hypothetical protein
VESIVLIQFEYKKEVTQMQHKSAAFTGKDYLAAAMERLSDVEKLSANANIVGAIYFAGTAVECIFRAHILLHTTEFDDKHDLFRLFKSSQIGPKLTESEKLEFTANLKVVANFWNNNLRYASGLRLRRTLGHEIAREGKKFKDVSNFLLKRYKPLLQASKQIINKGAKKWN